MLLAAATLALVIQDPPRPPSASVADYCQTVSARNVAAGGDGLACAASPPPLDGPVTLERCLEREAGRHPDCRVVLQPEADLVPTQLFNTAGQTPPARLQGWLDVVCGRDRLQPGQTTEACQAEKTALHGRAYAAREAMAGRGVSARDDDPFGTGIDLEGGFLVEGVRRDCSQEAHRDFDQALACVEAERAASGVGQPGDSYEQQADRCRRREESHRDETTGSSSSSYSVSCSWGSGDPELQRRNREMLDDMLRGD